MPRKKDRWKDGWTDRPYSIGPLQLPTTGVGISMNLMKKVVKAAETLENLQISLYKYLITLIIKKKMVQFTKVQPLQ